MNWFHVVVAAERIEVPALPVRAFRKGDFVKVGPGTLKKMKIAVAQISCTPGEVSANLRKIRDFAAQGKEAGAEMIVFPEMSDTGYSMTAIREKAAGWNEGAVPELRQIAHDLGLTIISGVSEKVGESIYNSQVVINGAGEIVARYRKTHLFAPVGEDKCCTPGQELVSFTEGDWRFGLTICYDLRFPEIYRALAVEQEVNVFIVSSAWPFPRVEHLRILALARAIENQSYLVLSNRVGKDDGARFCGGSTIIDPAGIVRAAASPDREELVVAELSPAVIKAVRDKMDVFAHRRPELYQEGSRR